jgi:hypothetical protein
MRPFLFVLAMLGALLAGWVPAMAATFDAGRIAAYDAHAGHQGHHGSGEDQHGKKALHPMACPACFAIPTTAIEAVPPLSFTSAYMSLRAPRFIGVEPLPLDPPPRS